MALATQQVKVKAAAERVSLHGNMVDNILEMLKGGDDAGGMKDKLLAVFAPDKPKFSPVKNAVVKMFRHGWQTELSNSQSFVTNLGVTAALVLSVTLGLVLQPVNSAVPEGDSMWDDSRDVMSDITFACFHLASGSALLCVIVSLMWVNSSIAHVHDADDFLWFLQMFERGTAVKWLVVCLVCTGVGVATVATVVWDGVVGSGCFFITALAILLTIIWYISKEMTGRKHTGASMEGLNGLCIAAIHEAWRQFQESEGTAAPNQEALPQQGPAS